MKKIWVWVSNEKEYNEFVKNYCEEWAAKGAPMGIHNLIPLRGVREVQLIDFSKDQVIRAGTYSSSPYFLQICVALQNAEKHYLNIAKLSGWML